MALGTGWSKTWTYFEGDWHEGNVPIMGPRTHAAWLCSIVFDGARYFEGVTPDLELHCARVNDSARKLFLKPMVATEEWVRLAREGIARFDKDAALYIRPMYWGEQEGRVGADSRSRVDPVVPVDLRSADAAAQGLLAHAVSFSTADHRDDARRCQGGMPLSQQFARSFRGA